MPLESSVSRFDYLALGDSYTIGEGVQDEDRWPQQLVRMLLDQKIVVEVHFLARTGWTTGELWQAVQTAGLAGRYDMVSLLIGVNNQYRGLSLDQYRLEFSHLLNRAVELSGGNPRHIVVLSIPDWGVTPFSSGRDGHQITEEINAFNALNRAESQRKGVHYVDITPNSRTAMDNPAMLAGDGLHPSGRMYSDWARFVLPIAQGILE